MGASIASLAEEPPSENANLNKLIILNGEKQLDFEPNFTSNNIHYTVKVQYFTLELVLIPVVQDYNAIVTTEMDNKENLNEYDDELIQQMEKNDKETSKLHEVYSTRNSNQNTSGQSNSMKRLYVGSKVKNLSVGKTCIRIKVRAEDNITIKSYELDIERLKWHPDGWKPGTQEDKYHWYRRGAEDGIPLAQYHLARLYNGEDGGVPDGIKLDVDAQILRDRYMLQAAQQGNLDAQNALAKNYFQQKVVESVLREDMKNCAIERKEKERENSSTNEENNEENNEEEQVAQPQSLMASLENQLQIDPIIVAKKTITEDLDSRALVADDYYNQAAYWFEKAASQDDKASATTLATMYINGQGVEMSYENAYKWLQKTDQANPLEQLAQVFLQKANNGDKDAAFQYGLMCLDGASLERSYTEACKWFMKSGMEENEAYKFAMERLLKQLDENKEDGTIAYQLASMYRVGHGTELDYKKVVEYLILSGETEAQAKQITFDWFTEDSQNSEAACGQLALLYIDGVGTLPDYKQAIEYLVRSKNWNENDAEKFVLKSYEEHANSEESNAQHSSYQLGLMHFDGIGTDVSYDNGLENILRSGSVEERAQRRSAELFQGLSENGDTKASFQLSLMYLDGIGVDVDFKKALQLHQTAEIQTLFSQRIIKDRLQANAENGNNRAAFQLAEMYMDWEESLKYLQNEGFQQQFFEEEAAKWYQQAAAQGDIEACLALGNMYIEWIGVPIDFNQAEHWLKKGGKSDKYIKSRIKQKLNSLKPYYEKLFAACDKAGDGHITVKQFEGFYRTCKVIYGMSIERAHELTTSRYQGKRKFETLYQAFDEDNSHSCTFEEIWAHPHTHTSIFPKVGKHVMSSILFFEEWDGQILLRK